VVVITLASDLVKDFSYPKTTAGLGATSTAVIDGTKITTSDQNCPIQKYTFSETSSAPTG
jgi:hypothetical protein